VLSEKSEGYAPSLRKKSWREKNSLTAKKSKKPNCMTENNSEDLEINQRKKRRVDSGTLRLRGIKQDWGKSKGEGGGKRPVWDMGEYTGTQQGKLSRGRAPATNADVPKKGRKKRRAIGRLF